MGKGVAGTMGAMVSAPWASGTLAFGAWFHRVAAWCFARTAVAFCGRCASAPAAGACKAFKVSGMVAVKRALEPVVKSRKPKEKIEDAGKLPVDTRDTIAGFVGVSGRTLEKAEAIVEAAERKPSPPGGRPPRPPRPPFYGLELAERELGFSLFCDVLHRNFFLF